MEAILNSLQSRVPWTVAALVLGRAELPRSLGWERTKSKLLSSAAKYPRATQALTEALTEHVLCGEKMIRFYFLEPAQIDQLREALLTAEVPASPFAGVYPCQLTGDSLNTAEAQEPTLVSVEQTHEGIGAVFASARLIEERLKLEPSALPVAAAEALSDFDDVYGTRRIRVPAMDVLWISNSTNMVDLRADHPVGAQHEIGLAALERLRRAVHKTFELELPKESHNVFPLIDTLYRSNEGRVVELHFSTTTASLKHEKMRREKLDLRSETYHEAGLAALDGHIDPHRVSVEWCVPLAAEIESLPEITLASRAKASGSINPILTECVVRNCTGLLDYEFVRGRVAHYLTPDP